MHDELQVPYSYTYRRIADGYILVNTRTTQCEDSPRCAIVVRQQLQ